MHNEDSAVQINANNSLILTGNIEITDCLPDISSNTVPLPIGPAVQLHETDAVTHSGTRSYRALGPFACAQCDRNCGEAYFLMGSSYETDEGVKYLQRISGVTSSSRFVALGRSANNASSLWDSSIIDDLHDLQSANKVSCDNGRLIVD